MLIRSNYLFSPKDNNDAPPCSNFTLDPDKQVPQLCNAAVPDMCRSSRGTCCLHSHQGLLPSLSIQSKMLLQANAQPVLGAQKHTSKSPRALVPVCRAAAQQPSSVPAEASTSRRDLMLGLVATGVACQLPLAQPAAAIQGLTAGRIPGLSADPDDSGFYTYTRPEGKSGGHGVGWSEIPRYSFKVPQGWGEIPVSIADLGGTEIDLRYQSQAQGDLSVVVAPILRFADVGFNASVTIEELGDPDKIIKGFAPELFGKPVDDDDVLSTTTTTKGGLTYYQWEVKPHYLVAATAYRNRMFIISVASATRQWRKHQADLRRIMDSFYVDTMSA